MDVTAREAVMNRYITAARTMIVKQGGSTGDIDASQKAWEAYRESYCHAIRDRWKDGTIRSARALGCRADLTSDRTHQLWKDYLVSMEDGRLLLPEPERTK